MRCHPARSIGGFYHNNIVPGFSGMICRRQSHRACANNNKFCHSYPYYITGQPEDDRECRYWCGRLTA